ncbi:MAG: hypothetical protein ABI539_13030 [Acidobacteriota bacterium]
MIVNRLTFYIRRHQEILDICLICRIDEEIQAFQGDHLHVTLVQASPAPDLIPIQAVVNQARVEMLPFGVAQPVSLILMVYVKEAWPFRRDVPNRLATIRSHAVVLTEQSADRPYLSMSITADFH